MFGFQFYIRLPEIKIILESVLVKKTVPILIVECSIDGDLKNPLTLVKDFGKIFSNVSHVS